MNALHRLLRKPDGRQEDTYYSLEIGYVCKLTGLDRKLIEEYANTDTFRGTSFQQTYNDTLNIFSYSGVTYVGLESRRIDYENDERAGINPISKMIEDGKY